jgi:NADH-quinone oxidoreductase subunit N
MNLGAFAVVIAVARRTRSGTIASYRGLFTYAPGLAVLFSLFLLSLAGIPPLAGWYAKFAVIRSLFNDITVWSVLLGVIVAVNTAIAAAYYLSLIKEMFFRPVEAGVDTRPVPIPAPLVTALGLTATFTIVLGFIPGAAATLGKQSTPLGACRDTAAVAGAPPADGARADCAEPSSP